METVEGGTQLKKAFLEAETSEAISEKQLESTRQSLEVREDQGIHSQAERMCKLAVVWKCKRLAWLKPKVVAESRTCMVKLTELK